MKRHTSLAPLSRQHHNALILAQLLKKGAPAYKGLPTDIKGKSDYAIELYQAELIKHFDDEEQILIKKTKGINTGLDQLSNEIIEQHKELKALFTLIKNTQGSEAHLDKLGYALEQHIRKEEREFFPLIQKLCSEELLSEIRLALSL